MTLHAHATRLLGRAHTECTLSVCQLSCFAGAEHRDDGTPKRKWNPFIRFQLFSLIFLTTSDSSLPSSLFFPSHSSSPHTDIIMFAARQSFNLFQKRAFSASASQVCQFNSSSQLPACSILITAILAPLPDSSGPMRATTTNLLLHHRPPRSLSSVPPVALASLCLSC